MVQINTQQHPSVCFTFEREIGAGSFSKVYSAVHKFTKVRYAVKVVVKAERKPQDLERLYSEINILSKLKHPHIIKLEQVYDYDGTVFLFLEYCEGGDLFDLIVKGSYFSEEEALPIMLQLLDAVNYLHSMGIAHRDLQPENILLYKKGGNQLSLKLADFGFAKVAGGRNNLMTSDVGTPDYAAPEILEQKYTLSVDMWAIGCILYCMLFSIPPFYSEDTSETLDKIVAPDTVVTFPEEFQVSSEAKDLILRLLDRNSATRLTAPQVLHHPWCRGAFLPSHKVPYVHRATESNRASLRSSINRTIEMPFNRQISY